MPPMVSTALHQWKIASQCVRRINVRRLRWFKISHFSSLRHCLRHSKWRVRWSVGRNFRPFSKFRYWFEPRFDAEWKMCTHLFVAQPTRELHFDFTSIQPLSKLEQFTAPYFRLDKGDVTDDCARERARPPLNERLLLLSMPGNWFFSLNKSPVQCSLYFVFVIGRSNEYGELVSTIVMGPFYDTEM